MEHPTGRRPVHAPSASGFGAATPSFLRMFSSQLRLCMPPPFHCAILSVCSTQNPTVVQLREVGFIVFVIVTANLCALSVSSPSPSRDHQLDAVFFMDNFIQLNNTGSLRAPNTVSILCVMSRTFQSSPHKPITSIPTGTPITASSVSRLNPIGTTTPGVPVNEVNNPFRPGWNVAPAFATNIV